MVFPDIEALFNITKTNHGLLNQITNLNGYAPEVLSLKLPAPVKPARWEDSQFKEFLSEIKTNRDRIIQSFVSETSIFRVYLPDEQIKSLESAVKADLIHPNIFLNPWKSTKAALEMHQLRDFLRKATERSLAESDAKLPKITIHQVISDSLVQPFKYDDYYQYLKISKAEENLEFLQSIHRYMLDAFPLFPEAMYPAMKSPHSPTDQYKKRPQNAEIDHKVINPKKPSQMSDAKFKESTESLKSQLSRIIVTHVRSNATREVNLPNTIKKPLLDAYENGWLHGDILMHSYEHIAEMLIINGFSKFLQEQVANSKINTIIEDSGPQISIDQALNNTAESPYSREDFRKYLMDFDQERKLDLLVDLVELDEMCRNCNDLKHFYRVRAPSARSSKESRFPNPPPLSNERLDASLERSDRSNPVKSDTATDDSYQDELSAIKDRAKQIIQNYIEPTDMGIHELLRKPILASEEHAFNPEVFTPLKLFLLESTEKQFQEFLTKTHEERLMCGLLSKLKNGYKSSVDKILLDLLPYPYLYQDFAEYCRVSGNLKELSFVRSVMQYAKKAAPLYIKEPKQFGASTLQRLTKKINSDKDSTRSNTTRSNTTANGRLSEGEKPKDMSPEDFAELSKNLEAEYKSIFEKYIIKSKSPDYVVLPPVVKEALIASHKSKLTHPDIFTRAYDCIASNLQKTVWNQYSATRPAMGPKTIDSI